MRFLLIDDEPCDRELISAELAQAFGAVECRHAIRPLEVEVALHDGWYDLVFLKEHLAWDIGQPMHAVLAARYPGLALILLRHAEGEGLSVTEVCSQGPAESRFAQAVAYNLRRTVARSMLVDADTKWVEEARTAEEYFLRVQAAIAQVAFCQLQPELLLPQLLATICHAQDYTFGLIYMVEEGCAAVVRASFGDEVAALQGTALPLGASDALVTQLLRVGQPSFANQQTACPLGIPALDDASMPYAVLGLPFVTRTNTVIGAMLLGNTDNPERFTERDMLQGVVLAYQMTQAIEHSMLFSQMQRLQEQHRVVTETLHDAVYMVDRAGRIVFTNPALERLTGYDRTALLGQPATMLSTGNEQHRPLPQPDHGRPAATRLPYTQGQMVRQDGQRIDVEMSTAPLVLDGQPLGSVTAVRDITQRLQLEAQLRQGQKLQALGTLVGGITHEFNNILNAILGYAEITLDDVPGESSTWENVQQIVCAAERAHTLLRGMRTFNQQTTQTHQPWLTDKTYQI